jgi:flagella basal body P-ring formation protein FlgA
MASLSKIHGTFIKKCSKQLAEASGFLPLAVLLALPFLGLASMSIFTSMALALDLAPQVVLPATFVTPAIVTVEQERILLGSLATCSGNQKVCEEAYGVDLGASPAPGKVSYLRRDKLLKALHNEWPEVTIELQAPTSLKIEAAFNVVTAEQIQAELSQTLSAATSTWSQIEGRPETYGVYAIEVDKVQLHGTLKVRPGGFRMEFPDFIDAQEMEPDWLVRRWNGSVALPVDLITTPGDDSVLEERLRVEVLARISLKQYVPVLKHNKDRGSFLKDEDFVGSWIRVQRHARPFITDPTLVRGQRLNRPGLAGLPLNLAQVETPTVISRGKVVKLLMRQKGLSVTSKVKALGAGRVGQTIEAIYLGTKKHIQVRVMNADTVEYIY